ncbi:indolepyruvate ferredoxin oxidoreductase [Candidatus Bipolaricaulota bacterium]|nr:indolepyruvate ferredoxin oxidoreductase [Candidatus Bipolaricaulota bacterium]
MATRLLLGDEALAQGAIDAGLSGAYAYPGTPSTEITEYVQRHVAVTSQSIHCRWSSNEKTALEEAVGMSYAGRRAMASMKHVGLNVAADPFINAALIGTRGGLLINVADDPSMHSSQNEQDSRLYGEMALVPCIEPADQQQAYDAAIYAFEFSERHELPVLLRLTTRLAHSRADVEIHEDGSRPQNPFSLPNDKQRFILLPAHARARYLRLLEQQQALVEASEESPFSTLSLEGDASLGIVSCGIAGNYVQETFGGKVRHPWLQIGQYPLPVRRIEALFSRCSRIIVLEEGTPFVESRLRGLPLRSSPEIFGRLTGHLPRTGELAPESVASAFRSSGAPSADARHRPSPLLRNRPPALCQGCPHIDSYRALNQAMAPYRDRGRVFADIGCYTLGAMPPLEAIDTCLCMGASITMAKGAADAGTSPAVAVIGDSTFAHSGLTGLLDCTAEQTPITVILLDNGTVAMTGGQDSQATGRFAQLCEALGVDREHIVAINPRADRHEESVAIIARELIYDGPSVIVAQRECIQTLRRSNSTRKPESPPRGCRQDAKGDPQ